MGQFKTDIMDALQKTLTGKQIGDGDATKIEVEKAREILADNGDFENFINNLSDETLEKIVKGLKYSSDMHTIL